MCLPGCHPDDAITPLTSATVDGSSGMPRPSIVLFNHPIMAMDRTIHSSCAGEKWARSSLRASSHRVAGTLESDRATSTAARSAGARPAPVSVDAT